MKPGLGEISLLSTAQKTQSRKSALPTAHIVYSPAQIRGAELAPAPALTNARADEFNSPWLPSVLSDGLPQRRCKSRQSHVNLTCKTKKLCVFREVAEGRDYEALFRVQKEQLYFSTSKRKNQSTSTLGRREYKQKGKKSSFLLRLS